MGRLLDLIGDDVSEVFLDSEDGFAVNATHYPGGNTATPPTVSGVFIPQEPTQDHDRGRGILHRAELWVESNETLLHGMAA